MALMICRVVAKVWTAAGADPEEAVGARRAPRAATTTKPQRTTNSRADTTKSERGIRIIHRLSEDQVLRVEVRSRFIRELRLRSTAGVSTPARRCRRP